MNNVDKSNQAFIMASVLETILFAPANPERTSHPSRKVLSATIAPTQLELRPTSGEDAHDTTSAYSLDLENLLKRIDSATTYYEVLGVGRDDGQEKIKSSFEHLLNLFYPPYVVSQTIPAETTSRIERAFAKASQAFAALASFTRRKQYDGALQSIASNRPASSSTQSQANRPKSDSAGGARRLNSSVAPTDQEVVLERMPRQGEVYSEYSRVKTNDNRRRCERFRLSIPARVTGYDRNNGKWSEMTETIDVSRTGVRLRLRRRVKHGTVLFLTLPLPTKLRAHGFVDQGYNVYSLVRRVEPSKHGVRAVGVEFLGEHPPSGFLDKPWAVFRPRTWGGAERRRPRRDERAEIVRIEYLDESLQPLSREQAKTENVSRFGLRVAGTAAPPEAEIVRVRCLHLKFESLAAIRSRYVGKDGLERLCMHLIDKEWPSTR